LEEVLRGLVRTHRAGLALPHRLGLVVKMFG